MTFQTIGVSSDAAQPKSGSNAAGGFGVILSVFAFLLALFGSIDHPYNFIGLREFPFRYAPTVLFAFSICLFALSGFFFQIFRSWPIRAALFLAIYQISGALYYVKILHLGDVDSSFLGRGLNMVALFAGAAVGASPILLHGMGRLTLGAAILISAFGLLLLTGHSFHLWFNQLPQLVRTPMIILAPGLAVICSRYPFLVLRFGIILLLALNGVLSGKSTHLLLALGIAGVSFGGAFFARLGRIADRMSRRGKLTLAMIATPVVLGMLGLFSWVLAQIVEERANRYEFDARKLGLQFRLDQFFAHPLFGDKFVATTDMSSVLGFGRNVPSHFDWLDILACGGLLGGVLFLSILVPALIGPAMRQSLAAQGRQVGFVQYAWYTVVFYAIGASGNPMLSDPYLSAPAWAGIGIVLGFAIGQRTALRPRTVSATRSKRSAHGVAITSTLSRQDVRARDSIPLA